MAATLLQKVWDAHTVRILPTGQTQLFVGLHLIHEVTTPQAFDELRQRGWKVRFPVANVRHGRPHHPDPRDRPAVQGRHGGGHDVGPRAQLPRLRHSALGSLARQPGHRARHRAGARVDAAGHDHRLRRFAHVDARRVRRGRLWHRHVAGPRRARLAVSGDGAAAGAAHRRDRPARAWRLRQGRDPRDHPAARGEGRRRLRLRVRRRGRRSHVDGRAHDDVQHVHRRRRARRLREPRRDHRGIPRRAAVRAAGRGVRTGQGVVGEHGL